MLHTMDGGVLSLSQIFTRAAAVEPEHKLDCEGEGEYVSVAYSTRNLCFIQLMKVKVKVKVNMREDGKSRVHSTCVVAAG